MKRLYYALVGAIAAFGHLLASNTPPTPGIVRYNLHPWMKRQYGKTVEGGRSPILAAIGRMVRAFVRYVTPQTVAMAALAILMLTVTASADASFVDVLTAEAPLAVGVKSMEQKHQKLMTELEAIDEKYQGEPMPTEVGEKFARLCGEAEDLQKQIDAELNRTERFDRIKKWGGDVDDPTIPPDGVETKQRKPGPRDIAAYMSLGDYVATQVEMAKMNSDLSLERASFGVSLAGISLLDSAIKGYHGETLVPIGHEQRRLIDELYSKMDSERKAIPTLGTGVIEPSRLPGITRVTEDDALRLRDVLSIAQTGTNAVEYWRRNAQTRAAAPTAEDTVKPEGTLGFDNQTANVRTIAAWIPATTQQLDDWPLLRSEIDNFLLYDLGKTEEIQIMYGSGAGQNLTGLTTVAGTVDVATVDARITTPTQLDSIRVAITEVRTNGYRPNALVIHPIDWEGIELLKATDDNYIWAVIQTPLGPRVWGLAVVESESCEDEAGNTTEERNWIVGDFRRGATLVDRMAPTVMVGLDSDDFTQNRRTILAEERVAFPIRAPAAFGVFQTQAPVA